jgi:hypothetical protein
VGEVTKARVEKCGFEKIDDSRNGNVERGKDCRVVDLAKDPGA